MKHRIILVDDDRDDRELFANTFQLVSDASLAACSSALEAIEVIADHCSVSEYHQPLVITDLNMPQVDGFELIARLRQELDVSPVIVVLSTSASRRDVTQAYLAGCNAYHVKPMGYVETKQLAERIVDYWQPLLELT